MYRVTQITFQITFTLSTESSSLIETVKPKHLQFFDSRKL